MGALRILVCCVAILGIVGHSAGLIGYFCLRRTNVFGIDLVSPLIRVAMTKYISYSEQLKMELYLKSIVDGSGIFASLLLLIGAWKRYQIPCLIYICYSVLYLFGLGIYCSIIGKMMMWGVGLSKMLKEVIPATLTATLLLLGTLNATAIIIQNYNGRNRDKFVLNPLPNNNIHQDKNNDIIPA